MYAENVGFNSGNISSGSAPNTFNPDVAITLLANYNVIADQAWYIDFRATNHITHNAGIFLTCSNYNGIEKLYIGNGLCLTIKHVRSFILKTQFCMCLLSLRIYLVFPSYWLITMQ